MYEIEAKRYEFQKYGRWAEEKGFNLGVEMARKEFLETIRDLEIALTFATRKVIKYAEELDKLKSSLNNQTPQQDNTSNLSNEGVVTGENNSSLEERKCLN